MTRRSFYKLIRLSAVRLEGSSYLILHRYVSVAEFYRIVRMLVGFAGKSIDPHAAGCVVRSLVYRRYDANPPRRILRAWIHPRHAALGWTGSRWAA